MINTLLRCYLCEQTELDRLSDFNWLVKCRNCGITFNPDLSINAQEVSDRFYDSANVEHREKIRSALFQAARMRWNWLQDRIALPVGRLLEIGCGTGEFLVLAREHGWQIHGLELSTRFREVAQAWYHIDLDEHRLSDAELSPESFDVVALFHVFEHLPDPLEFLSGVCAAIKPGGWLFIIVPNVDSLTDSLFGKRNPTLLKPDHFFHYDTATLHQMIERSDFRQVAITTLEPAHHIWTSLYGFLGASMKSRASESANLKSQAGFSVTSRLKSNIPYWVGKVTSLLFLPLRVWMQKRDRGHEIYLLCQKPS